MEDTYEGSFEERRVIEYTLEFTMKLYFFGPVYTGSVIKSVIEREYINTGNANFTTSEINESGLVKRSNITNLPLQNIECSVPTPQQSPFQLQ